MTDQWRLLISPPARGAWNMAIDEAILESAGRGESLSTLRLYAWDPACLSLGYAQPFGDVNLEALAAYGWETVRRPTGGRAILHTDELTYSVTAGHEEPRVMGSILESYSRLARALVTAVREMGLPVEVQEHEAAERLGNNPVCFEVPSTYEITVGGKKLIGSAQARRKEGVLQHGSLPLYGDLTRITQALIFPDEAARQKAATRLLERATTVETVLQRVIDWQTAADAMIQAFERELDLQLVPGELTPKENARAAELLREHYDDDHWTRRI
jgi:lipoate-protein ligase A